ncbi:MAG: helix-turn-helix transcriptional regulator [Thermodesulfobacteria bacterium]|nr:helix-turn-helix transcriptional regulator [Thermodesulfobacteriota bacterium]
MRLASKFLTYFKDPIARGFALVTLVLIGVGLEQDLLPSPGNQSFTFMFLIGNIAGLPLGLLSWKKFFPESMLPLAAWPLEGLLAGLCICKPAPVLGLTMGLVFGVLIVHLILLCSGKMIEYIVIRAGIGIIAGNTIIYALSSLPFPIGLLIICVLLASLRIQKPALLPNALSLKIKRNKKLIWFWIFCLCFYTLGGLYNGMKNLNPPNVPSKLFWFICLVCYIGGIAVTILLSRYEKNLSLRRLIPFGAVAIMGLALTIQMSKGPWSIWSMTLMDFSFGLMDCFSVTFLLAFSDHISQAATGMAIFPVSIILGIELEKIPIHNSLFEYQWALGFLFITLLPLYLSLSELKTTSSSAPLPLPPPDGEKPSLPVPSPKPVTATGTQASRPERLNRTVEEIAIKLGLSQREKEVFQELILGKKLKDIAAELDLALGTIKALCNRIYEKAGVKGKKELIKKFKLSDPGY